MVICFVKISFIICLFIFIFILIIYVYNSFDDMMVCSMNERGGMIFMGSSDALISFSLTKSQIM